MSAPSRLRHDALAYTGDDGFLAQVEGFLLDGNDAGDACMVLAPTVRLDSVRSMLGPSAPHMTFFDMTIGGRNPARVLPAIQNFRSAAPGRRARVLTDAAAARGVSSLDRELRLAELMFSLPLQQAWDGWLRCCYDTAALSAGELGTVQACHPGPDGLDVAVSLLAESFAMPLEPCPADAARRAADVTTLRSARHFVAERAAAAGLATDRCEDFVYAVNEAVTNSICHGEGRADVRIWTQDGCVVCSVCDGGRVHDVLAGRVAPQQGRSGGRGLSLINQMCDLVQLASSASGTEVRMWVDL